MQREALDSYSERLAAAGVPTEDARRIAYTRFVEADSKIDRKEMDTALRTELAALRGRYQDIIDRVPMGFVNRDAL